VRYFPRQSNILLIYYTNGAVGILCWGQKPFVCRDAYHPAGQRQAVLETIYDNLMPFLLFFNLRFPFHRL